MFPIELNQGGNYLIIRLCLAGPSGERGESKGGKGKDGRGRLGRKKKKQRGKEERDIFILTKQEAEVRRSNLK